MSAPGRRVSAPGRRAAATPPATPERKPEREILHDILAALGALPDVRVFRNSVGQAVDPRTHAHIRFGLAVGSSDIIGIGPGGRFLALEVKSATGRPTPEQLAFVAMVKRLGGVAGVVRSVDEAVQLVDFARAFSSTGQCPPPSDAPGSAP